MFVVYYLHKSLMSFKEKAKPFCMTFVMKIVTGYCAQAMAGCNSLLSPPANSTALVRSDTGNGS